MIRDAWRECWPDEYVFVLGHMRSYSTVLAHVLGSHAEIAGYTESHIKYRRRSDLSILRWRIWRATGRWPRGRYLLDKQLHNRMHIPPQLRASEQLRCLILLRPPRATLRSILRMGARTGNARDQDVRSVAAYYCQRVAALQALAVELGERALAIAAERIPGEARSLLPRIARHLRLTTPLEAHYRTGPRTGRAGYGDVSERIHAGTIVAREFPEPVCELRYLVPEDWLARCEQSYERCVATLQDWVPTVGFGPAVESGWQHNPLAERCGQRFPVT
ncbi:MAG: hypothetical protein U1F11_12445 [Steroidobacteraceae bacterium]